MTKEQKIGHIILVLVVGLISYFSLYFAIEAIRWREIARLHKITVINDNPANYLIAIEEKGETYYFSRYGRKCHEDEQPECVDSQKTTDCSKGICVGFVGCQEWSCLTD